MSGYQALSVLIYILIALILVCEAVLALRSLAERKRVILLVPGHPELANANQFALSIGWLGSLDSIVIVTLARRLCLAKGIPVAFTSLPVVTAGIGSVVGIMLFRPLRNRFGTRSIVSLAYALYTFSALACLWCVGAGALGGLCAAKLIGGVGGGLLNAVLYRLPSLWREHDAGMRKVATDSENGLLTSGILGVFAGGLLAGQVSYASIYALEAVTAVVCLLLGRLVFIKKESRFNHPDRSQKKAMSSRAYAFMLKPAMLSLLLIFVLYNGTVVYYKQIVFPLFADDLGFSEQTVSNMYVLVRCLVYFSFRFIEKLTQKISDRRILIGSQLVMGGAFLVFLHWDASFLWASAMLLITGILCKLVKNHGTVLWNRELYWQQIKSYYANPPIMTASALISVLAPGLLSFLLSLGIKIMAAAMGLSAIGLTLLYIAVNARHGEAVSEEL